MIRVRLTKTSPNSSNLRTNIVDGVIENKPAIGESMTILSEGIMFGTRVIQTTEIKEIHQRDDFLMVHTQNSIYKLEFLE